MANAIGGLPGFSMRTEPTTTAAVSSRENSSTCASNTARRRQRHALEERRCASHRIGPCGVGQQRDQRQGEPGKPESPVAGVQKERRGRSLRALADFCCSPSHGRVTWTNSGKQKSPPDGRAWIASGRLQPGARAAELRPARRVRRRTMRATPARAPGSAFRGSHPQGTPACGCSSRPDRPACRRAENRTHSQDVPPWSVMKPAR